VKTRKEDRQQVFTAAEWIVLALVVLGAIGAAVGLATGRIAI